jgi:hypothetical protein
MLRIIMLSLLLVGCGQSVNSQNDSATADMQAAEESHHYAVYSDGEYGYERAVSEDDKNAGQIASTVMLFKYLGEKDGLYQVMHTESEGVDLVLECENPCKFIRTYTLVNHQLGRKEMLPATEGTIGYLVMDDAINGRLKRHIFGTEGLQHTMWYSNSKMDIQMTKDTHLSREERQALGLTIEGGEKPEPVQAAAVENVVPGPSDHVVSENGTDYVMPTHQDMGIEEGQIQQQ